MNYGVLEDVRNQKHEDSTYETQSENISEANNENGENSNSCTTPATDIEAPLSPVLSSSKQSLRHLFIRRTRKKLMDKFAQNLESQEISQISISPKENNCTEINSQSWANNLVPEKPVSVINKENNSKDRLMHSLDTQHNSSENLITQISSEKCPQAEMLNDITESFVSKTNISDCMPDTGNPENEKTDFNFKVPESPVTKTKRNIKNITPEVVTKIESSINPNIGFKTGNGKNVNLSERSLKRASKLFDDINILPESKDIVITENESHKESVGMSFEKIENFSTVGFKTASGSHLKLSENALLKSKKLFNDIFDLSNYNETEHPANISKNSSSDPELSDSFNQAIQNLFNDSFEIKSDKTDVSNNKTNKISQVSQNKELFSQISDTQMCIVAENAENVADFSQWTSSPNEKIHKSQNKENVDIFSSPEAEQFFSNLTFRDDGTLIARNYTINKSSSDDCDENLKETDPFLGFPSIANKQLDISEELVKKESILLQNSHATTVSDSIVFNVLPEKNNKIIANINKIPEENIDSDKLHKTVSYENNCENKNFENKPVKISGNTTSINYTKINNIKNISNIEVMKENVNKELEILKPQHLSLTENTNILKFNYDVDNNETNTDCCGFTWEEALKSLKIHELYKRSFKYIEKDIKNNIYYPISFTINDIYCSKDYKNKSYKYAFRNRKKSGTIYFNREKKSSAARKSSSEFSNLSNVVTRSKSLKIEDANISLTPTSVPKTSSRKIIRSQSHENEKNDFSKTIENKSDTKNIADLEDAFLSSVENSLNFSPNITSKKVNTEDSFERIDVKMETNYNYCSESNILDNARKNDILEKMKQTFNAKTISKRKLNSNNCDEFEILQNKVQNKENRDINSPKSDSKLYSLNDKRIVVEQNLKISENIFKITDTINCSTVSGKKSNVFNESLEKAFNMFQDCDVGNTENIAKNYQNIENTENKRGTKNVAIGFTTSSEKIASIFEEILIKAENIPENSDSNIANEGIKFLESVSSLDYDAAREDFEIKSEVIDEIPDIYNNTLAGFATVSRKKISLSEEAVTNANNIFQDCNTEEEKNTSLGLSEEPLNKAKNVLKDCDINEEIKDENLESTKNVASFGFSIAAGKQVSISEESLRKKDRFEDCNIDGEVKDKHIEASKNITSFRFTGATGKKVPITEESLRQTKNLFKDCNFDEETENENVEVSKNIPRLGLSTSAQKKVSNSEESFIKGKNLFEDCNFDEEIEDNNVKVSKNIASFGFLPAAGKKVSISEESLQKAKNRFEDCNFDEGMKDKNVEASKNITSFGFTTATGKKVPISEKSLRQAKNLFEDCNFDEGIKDKNVEASENITSFGFTTATGKKVPISEKSLRQAKNLFEDCNFDEGIKDKNVEASENITSFGFTTATGKKVPISEKSLRQAKNLFEDCNFDVGVKDKNIEASKNITSFGCTTATSKKVPISEKSLRQAKNLFEDCNFDEGIKDKNVEASENITSFGFTTATGKKVPISEKSLRQAKNLFEDCNFDEGIKDKNVEASGNITSFGFTTATGKKVPISEKSLRQAKNLFEDCNFDGGVKDKNIEASKNSASFGFTTAAGNKVSISEESLEKVENLSEDCNFDKETSDKNIDISSSFEFLTATGNSVSISEESLKKVKNVFQDCANKEETNQKSDEISKYSFGFATASGKNVAISDEAIAKVKTLFTEEIPENSSSSNEEMYSTPCDFTAEEDNNINSSRNAEKHISNTPKNKESNSFSVTSNKSYSSPQVSSNNFTPILSSKSVRNSKKRSLGVSSCRQLDIAESNLKRAKLVFEDIDIPKKNENINNNIINYSPKTPSSVMKIPQKVKITPISAQNKSLLNSSITVKETNQSRISENLPTPRKSQVGKFCLENEDLDENSSFVLREETTGDPKKWCTDLQKDLETLKVKISVVETRMVMLNQQQDIIKNGSSDHRRQRPGNLFSQKIENKNRISLIEAVKYRRPEKNTQQICLNLGLDSSLLKITAENSSSLHFHVPWWLNDNRTYPAVIRTEDGAVIIPNQHNLIGVSEIEQAFLAMPGIDPTLVPNKWVLNHYRWIVWKIASMERNYPDIFKNYLDVENVMNQLKYRYDREIDRAQRPALRKIIECDDTAAKRMVLCVATIINLPENKHELELTDGWYSIKTIIDVPLNSLVEKKLIKVGTKLMIQGAELLNCEGCCPLELPANVRLQIHHNSTRRAAWYLKLGYQPNPGPLRISLRMISNNGGPIGGVRAYVARVYPISFMERSDVMITWRNERAEMRRTNQWEAEYANTMENMQMIVQQELENEWEERRKKNKSQKLNIMDLKDVNCGEMLYRFLQESQDPDSVKGLLTASQISALQDYQAKLNTEQQNELTSRLREKLKMKNIQPRNVSQVLRILLVDVQSLFHSRMLNIWRPTETHTQMLKEGIVINIYNVSAKNNGTLSSMPRTQFEEDSDFDTTKFENLSRFVLPISQMVNPDLRPFFGEFDTTGMAVVVDTQQLPQILWLVDENYRFLLVKIREASENCILFDSIGPGKVVTITNLIYQKPLKSYGEAVANQYSVLSCYPQQKYLLEFLQEFIASLPEDVEKYLEECTKLVNSFSTNCLKRRFTLSPLCANTSEKKIEALGKKLRGLDYTQQNKSDSQTLSDEEMALIDTQAI